MPGPKASSPFPPAQSKACHNCRRRRLRCDRSYPTCHKCSINGEECLGYGKVLRWANAPAVRGKLACKSSIHNESQVATIQHSLIDPLLNRLDQKSRGYMHHCRYLAFLKKPVFT
ncbi:acriflavine sensitivity control protein acr-2 [Cladorrhinum samala]|uniref:Acriflavine sensitivity control protein acr-2 n=1 Tax=Cladorrhinum samala TaxID=585594 RepID=A0AAV9HK55_9PEZI|nr:acriflavine sensitivity control protein acr-2 [Cladorrhinum samala]